MRLYYDTERPNTNCDNLFVSNSTNNSRSQCISTHYGTDTFYKAVRKAITVISAYPEMFQGYQKLEEGYTYHTLRHSFATDLFYDFCVAQNKHPDSITTESAVYLETARRMGHKVDGRYSPRTVKSYIHSCGHRERILKETGYGF